MAPRAPARLLACLSLALLPCASALRESTALQEEGQALMEEAEERRMTVEELVDSGDLSSFEEAEESSGALVGGRAASAAALSTSGTHVCCVTFTKKKVSKGAPVVAGWGGFFDQEKGEEHISGWNVAVYHESAAAEIKKCHLTMVTSSECQSHSECVSECEARVVSDRRFMSLTQREKLLQFQRQRTLLQKQVEAEDTKRTVVLEALDKAYSEGLAPAQEALNETATALATAQGEYEAAKLKVEELPEEIRQLEAQQSVSQESLDRAKEVALSSYEEGKEAAHAKAEAAKEQLAGQLANLTLKEELYQESFANSTDRRPPPACRAEGKGKAGPYAAVDCCCVIQGTPMKVDARFGHWDLCKAAVPWSKTSWSFTGCSLFQECQQCRKVSCGTGVCPGA